MDAEGFPTTADAFYAQAVATDHEILAKLATQWYFERKMAIAQFQQISGSYEAHMTKMADQATNAVVQRDVEVMRCAILCPRLTI